MDQLPVFFYDGLLAANTTVALDADATKHIWQVLRMQTDDKIRITDGKGNCAEATIRIAERHKCTVTIAEITHIPRTTGLLHLCVVLTKNNSRNEWLLEKATELGAASIIPIITKRSERIHPRNERWQKILQSAILQSQQYHLPLLTELTSLDNAMAKYKNVSSKLIAHCIEDNNKLPLQKMLKRNEETVILIGPEGDFTQEEVDLCKENGFTAVSLSANRLRTETAAIVAAAYFNTLHNEKD